MRHYPAVLALVLLVFTCAARAADDYALGADSQVRTEVPKGEVRQRTFAASKIFPGTTPDYFVYVPKQYDPAKPACLTVFFDGGGFFRPDGAFRVPVVFDNLIAKKEMHVDISFSAPIVRGQSWRGIEIGLKGTNGAACRRRSRVRMPEGVAGTEIFITRINPLRLKSYMPARFAILLVPP